MHNRMALNLPILSLDIIDSLSYQKCLIPKDKFPKKTTPGQWAKCFFLELSSGIQYHAIAQIFPREDLCEVCYLDGCVSNYNYEVGNHLILKDFIALKNEKEIKSAKVLIQLNAEYFIQNSNLLDNPYLRDLSNTVLQKYHLRNGCLIKDKYLEDNGIHSICLELEEDSEDSSFIITEKTNVIIKNVALKYKEVNSDRLCLNVEPLAQAREELDDLIKYMRIQRGSRKRSICMSLNAVLVGAVGCGKTSIMEEFLLNHHCNVFRIEATKCLKQYPGETEAELKKIFKAARDFEEKYKSNDPTVILIEEIHLLCPQANSTSGNKAEVMENSMRICTQLLSLIDGLFTSKASIICLATSSKSESINEVIRRPGRFGKEIVVASLQKHHRCSILRKLLKQSMPNFNITPLLLKTMGNHTQGYVLADLALLVRKVTQVVLTKPEENVDELVLDILMKSQSTSLKGTDVTAYKTMETFDVIGGMLQLKKKLQVSVLAGLKQQENFKRFGLSLPKGVLLYGPPGCAKTTIAKCLATEANMTFIATSSAEVYSPYVGCAEKFIAKIFQTARKNSPCLIFLDEIDSLVGRRSLAASSNTNDVQTRILSTLLTEMDGIVAPIGHNSQIVVVAATNRPDMVDDALMRPGRFDKLVHVTAPDFLSRRAIFNLYKKRMPFAISVDLDSLAFQTENYSGADICNICNEAGLQAFQRDFYSEEITMEDFQNVLKKSKSSLDKTQIDWYYKFENKSV